ncbi:MAG: DNA translocase FtsK [Ktedonobacteraceae bacterium]|nr:DNA translocase FtsK [Ktedonobacteraceae bacterium]
MAGDQQKKESKRQNERVVPSLAAGPARVSRAAGSIGSQSAKKTRQGVQSLSSLQQTQRGGQRRKQTRKTKRGGSSSRSAPPVVPTTRDSQFIKWLQHQWNSMEPHQQQRFFSFILLIFSLLLFGSLTIFRSTPILGAIGVTFLKFFNWSAYLLALGLIAFAVAHLAEGILKQRFLRWSTVIGLLCIWLLLLIESRLLFGPVGILAEVLIYPLLGWSLPVAHVTTLGLLLIAFIVTFRITFGHVLRVCQALCNLFSPPHRQPSGGNTVRPSPFLGQRPKYSRYGGGAMSFDAASSSTPKHQAGPQAVRPSRRSIGADNDQGHSVDPDDETLIEFTPDFGEEDFDEDVDKAISLPKHVPRDARMPQPFDPVEHAKAVQGVSRQPLPFNQAHAVPKNAVGNKKHERMEPLQPNPNKQSSRQKTAPREPDGAAHALDSPWKLPDTSLLHNPEEVKLHMLGDDTATLAKLIQDTLRSFRVEAEVRQEDISIGPTVIRFGIRPTGKPQLIQDEKTGKMVPVRDADGNIVYDVRTRVSRIMALQNDLALVLEAKTIRMEAPVPGRPYIGVEIPNKNSRLVTLREVLESKEYQTAKAKSKLAIGLGKDVAGAVRVGDLARMPHLLIAGATGAGKSVQINSIIASIITQATPDDVRLLMVDPKMVELNMYNGIPHLLSPVVTEVERVVPLLKNAIHEMERRYRLFSQLGVRNLDSYRRIRAEKLAKGDSSLANMPAIVIIIDELADLMMAAPEEVEGMICRLAQLARATGIHLVVATQRPSVDVITGLIKANIPTRISFMVSSAVDSRTIIDMGGAERLLGRGDMLYLPADAGRPERIQGSFVADDEAEALVAFWQQQHAEHLAAASGASGAALAPVPTQIVEPGWEIQEHPSDDFELDDDLLEKAEEVVREYGRASISLLQRRLRIGYSRAARLIDLLEEHGIVSPFEQGGRSREVLDNNDDDDRGNGGFGEGHTIADEADDIMAEERARNEFLRKQAAAGRSPQQGRSQAPAEQQDDET